LDNEVEKVHFEFSFEDRIYINIYVDDSSSAAELPVMGFKMV
jgi:hypothetical protein